MDSVQIILKLLQDKGLKRKDLANHLGINQSAIADWKSGKTKSYMRYLPQIASFLGVQINDLVDENDIFRYLNDSKLSEKSSSVSGMINDNERNYYQIKLGSKNRIRIEFAPLETCFPSSIQAAYNKLSDRSKLQVQMFILDKSEEEEKEKNL